MRLLCISDVHGEATVLDGILQHAGAVDLVLLGGDLTNFGTPNQAERLVAMAQLACPRVLAVAGNCDSAAIDDRLTELSVSLFGRGVVYEAIGFCGVSAMPPWLGQMYELTEDEIAAALGEGYRQIREAPRAVVLSHTPPRGCRLDRTPRGEQVGSTAVRRFIETSQPALVVCGHIHESRGVDMIGAATVVNCGPAYRGQYAIAELNESVQVELRAV